MALIIGFSIGLFAGFYSYFSFVKCSPAEKKHWEEDRLMHHYTLGLIAVAIGILSPLIAGIGIGLILTDAGDLRRRIFDVKPHDSDYD